MQISRESADEATYRSSHGPMGDYAPRQTSPTQRPKNTDTPIDIGTALSIVT